MLLIELEVVWNVKNEPFHNFQLVFVSVHCPSLTFSTARGFRMLNDTAEPHRNRMKPRLLSLMSAAVDKSLARMKEVFCHHLELHEYLYFQNESERTVLQACRMQRRTLHWLCFYSEGNTIHSETTTSFSPAFSSGGKNMPNGSRPIVVRSHIRAFV